MKIFFYFISQKRYIRYHYRFLNIHVGVQTKNSGNGKNIIKLFPLRDSNANKRFGDKCQPFNFHQS